MKSRSIQTALIGAMFLLGATGTANAIEWPPRVDPDKNVQPIKWDWQLIQPAVLNDDPTIEIYDIDMFLNETSGIVGELQSRGKKVVCYVNFGAWEVWRDDAADYPRSIIGDEYDDFPGENWFDIRDVNPAKSKTGMALARLLEVRIDRAKQMGCDAIEPDNIDGFDDTSHNHSGFPLTYEDQIFFNVWAANAVHERGMAIALKNNTNQALDPRIVEAFDFVVTESCIFFGECFYFQGFLDAGKPVFLTEYLLEPAEFCAEAKERGLSAIHKNFSLDSFRENCDDYYDSSNQPDPEPETVIAPKPTTNLLVNGGFESGLSGWSSCAAISNLSNSNNTTEGSNAIRFNGNAACMYQEVPVTPGDNYALSCDANKSGSDWTVIELSFVNRQFNRLATESERLSATRSYKNYTMAGTAPSNAEYAIALVYSESQLLVDNCNLINKSEPTQNVPKPNPPVTNLLRNGGFENDLTGWLSCGNSDDLYVSTDSSEGDNSLAIGAGQGCLYQEVSANANVNYSLSCDAHRTGSQWSIMQLSYLDSQFNNLETKVSQIANDGSFSSHSLQGRAPANTSKVIALLYSEDYTIVDNCVLSAK